MAYSFNFDNTTQATSTIIDEIFSYGLTTSIINKPSGQERAKKYTDIRAITTHGTLNDFIEHVCKRGYAFTACTYKTQERHEDNFALAHLLVLDLDNEKQAPFSTRYSVQSLAEIPFFQENAMLAYSTPSSTPNKPKSRLIFRLERPITTLDDYKHAHDALRHFVTTEFSLSTHDASKHIFNGNSKSELVSFGQFLSTKTLNDILGIYERHEQASKTQISPSDAMQAPSTQLSEFALNQITKWISEHIQRVASARTDRNSTLYLNARYIASWVKAYSEFQHMWNELERAAIAIGLGAKETKSTMKSAWDDAIIPRYWNVKPLLTLPSTSELKKPSAMPYSVKLACMRTKNLAMAYMLEDVWNDETFSLSVHSSKTNIKAKKMLVEFGVVFSVFILADYNVEKSTPNTKGRKSTLYSLNYSAFIEYLLIQEALRIARKIYKVKFSTLLEVNEYARNHDEQELAWKCKSSINSAWAELLKGLHHESEQVLEAEYSDFRTYKQAIQRDALMVFNHNQTPRYKMASRLGVHKDYTIRKARSLGYEIESITSEREVHTIEDYYRAKRLGHTRFYTEYSAIYDEQVLEALNNGYSVHVVINESPIPHATFTQEPQSVLKGAKINHSEQPIEQVIASEAVSYTPKERDAIEAEQTNFTASFELDDNQKGFYRFCQLNQKGTIELWHFTSSMSFEYSEQATSKHQDPREPLAPKALTEPKETIAMLKRRLHSTYLEYFQKCFVELKKQNSQFSFEIHYTIVKDALEQEFDLPEYGLTHKHIASKFFECIPSEVLYA